MDQDFGQSPEASSFRNLVLEGLKINHGGNHLLEGVIAELSTVPTDIDGFVHTYKQKCIDHFLGLGVQGGSLRKFMSLGITPTDHHRKYPDPVSKVLDQNVEARLGYQYREQRLRSDNTPFSPLAFNDWTELRAGSMFGVLNASKELDENGNLVIAPTLILPAHLMDGQSWGLSIVRFHPDPSIFYEEDTLPAGQVVAVHTVHSKESNQIRHLAGKFLNLDYLSDKEVDPGLIDHQTRAVFVNAPYGEVKRASFPVSEQTHLALGVLQGSSFTKTEDLPDINLHRGAGVVVRNIYDHGRKGNIGTITGDQQRSIREVTGRPNRQSREIYNVIKTEAGLERRMLTQVMMDGFGALGDQRLTALAYSVLQRPDKHLDLNSLKEKLAAIPEDGFFQRKFDTAQIRLNQTIKAMTRAFSSRETGDYLIKLSAMIGDIVAEMAVMTRTMHSTGLEKRYIDQAKEVLTGREIDLERPDSITNYLEWLLVGPANVRNINPDLPDPIAAFYPRLIVKDRLGAKTHLDKFVDLNEVDFEFIDQRLGVRAYYRDLVDSLLIGFDTTENHQVVERRLAILLNDSELQLKIIRIGANNLPPKNQAAKFQRDVSAYCTREKGLMFPSQKEGSAPLSKFAAVQAVEPHFHTIIADIINLPELADERDLVAFVRNSKLRDKHEVLQNMFGILRDRGFIGYR